MEHGITKVFTCGLAIDFCVSATAVDCAEHGLETYIINDATRGITAESMEASKKEMADAGVKAITTSQVCYLVNFPCQYLLTAGVKAITTSQICSLVNFYC